MKSSEVKKPTTHTEAPLDLATQHLHLRVVISNMFFIFTSFYIHFDEYFFQMGGSTTNYCSHDLIRIFQNLPERCEVNLDVPPEVCRDLFVIILAMRLGPSEKISMAKAMASFGRLGWKAGCRFLHVMETPL